MQISEAIEFVAERKNAMLLAIKSDGRPQSSNVVYVVNDAGQILISVTEGRAKTKNLRRDLRASLHVNRDNFWANGRRSTADNDPDAHPCIRDAASLTTVQVAELRQREVAGEHGSEPSRLLGHRPST